MRFKLIYILLIAFCLSAIAQSRWQHTINSGWEFYQDNVAGADAKVDWQVVNVPHCWNVDDVMNDTPGYYRDTACYKKDLFIPSAWKDREVYLVFDAIAITAEVYVNGHLAAHHDGAYTSFNVPISKYLKFSEEGNCKNEVFVRANNSYNADIPPLSADFTFFGGLYRDVHLLVLDKVHFRMDQWNSEGIFWNTPKVSEQEASLTIKGAFENATSEHKRVLVKHVVTDSESQVVLVDEQKYKCKANSSFDFSQDYTIHNPKLWSPESPELYSIVSQMICDGEVVDQIENPLAFRWFAFDAEKGFSLNGKPYELVGTSRHQDHKDLGNALSDERHIRDVELLKQMGGNFLRISHYPQDKAVIEACDRLGILTSIEIPLVNRITDSKGFFDNSEIMLREMMAQYYNHPSLIVWAYMNEILLRPPYKKDSPEWKPYLEANNRLFSGLEKVIRENDPYRYTMMVGHGGGSSYKDAGLIDIPMIFGWNIYTGWYDGKISSFGASLDKRKALSGNTPILVTEYGADADYRIHNFDADRFDKSIEYATDYHIGYMKAFRERDFVNGMLIWNLSDFSSETRGESTPHVNAKGILTQDRKVKDGYRFYQANLLKEPYLQIGSKEWTERSAASDKASIVQPVQVFSNQAEVELIHNGVSLGYAICESGVARFDVPFTNGKNQLLAKAKMLEIYDETTVEFTIVPQDLKANAFPANGINVSLGDKRFYADRLNGVNWIPEQEYAAGSWGYIGGKVFKMANSGRQNYGSDKDVLSTDLDAIYETQRVGIESFTFDVPQGKYRVTLHFAELLSDIEHEALAYNLGGDGAQKDGSIERVFAVQLNGKDMIPHLSNEEYLVPERAVKFGSYVFVHGEEGIQVDFNAEKGQAILNAIQLVKIY